MCKKMPIIRKVITAGGSRAVTLPKSWLEYLEQKNGCKIEEVALEVDHVLTIKPIIATIKKRRES